MTSNRTSFVPIVGGVYRNKGGGYYKCIGFDLVDRPIMKNTASGWTFTAHGIGIYTDGLIDWDFSTKGRFEK